MLYIWLLGVVVFLGHSIYHIIKGNIVPPNTVLGCIVLLVMSLFSWGSLLISMLILSGWD